MGKWKEHKLQDLCVLQRGHDLPRSEMKEGLYPVAGSNGVIGYHNAYTTEAPGVTIGRSGSIGEAYFYGTAFWAHNTVLFVKDFKSSDPKFVYYFLKRLDFDQFNAGSAVPTLNRNHIHDLVVSIPAPEEQRAIAGILSSLDDKIDLLHRQNKTLEALAETLFRQWFVKKAEEGWKKKSLDQLIDFDPKEKIDHDREYGFFDMKCLSNDSMSMSEGRTRKVNSGSSFRNGDTLLAKITPCLENGKTGFVMNLNEGEIARGSTEFIVMRAKENVSPYFVYCLARYSDFRDTAIVSMTGTSGRQRVQTQMLKTYEISFSRKAIDEFHRISEPCFHKVRQNQLQIRTLTQLRDTLLPKLMSGEVRVCK